MTAPLRQRDVEKAVRGAIKGGLEIGRVEIDPATGRILILPAGPGAVHYDPLDDELAEFDAEHGGHGRPR